VAHADLARQALELERSNAALERFAAEAGNEISEPLHTAAGFLDLLINRHSKEMGDEARLLAERAGAGVERARARIGEVLEFARASTVEFERRPVDLTEVLSEARAGLPRDLVAKATITLAGPLPTVLGDRAQLVRLFSNLLDNALRYRGDHPPEVTVSAQASPGSGWRLALSDNGRGIDAAELPRLFTVWGSGLGLGLCRRIVERHGGRIGAEAGASGGTMLWFELPG
jgi:signal transduction histidine kinase